MTSAEIGLVAFSCLVLVTYHTYWRRTARRRPERTIIGFARATRDRWLESIVRERRDLLAVQTLRNSSMAASFLASTAILIASGLFGILLTKAHEASRLLHQLNHFGSTDPQLLTVKLLLLSSVLLIAFLNFSLAIRYYTHVSFEINAIGDGELEYVHQMLGRGAQHYTMGMRCLYLSIPLLMWLLGPLWMALGSLGLCAALYRFDFFRYEQSPTGERAGGSSARRASPEDAS